uniref:TolA-like protein n=2 Tax=Hirondellea gigas TaxID=1518452 RepID=A0A6A7GBQ4_9CRUS
MSNDMEKLARLSALVYSDQAKWFLNAYFERFDKDMYEKVWDYTNKMVEIDEKRGKEGCELQELYAHRFLEHFGETLTVSEMRKVLRDIDIDNNKNVSLSEFLIFNYKVDWHELVNAAQSDNKEEIDEAVRLVQQAMSSMDIAREARAAASKAETEAGQAAQAARTAEAAQLKAEAAVKQALAELEAEEKAFSDRKSGLEAKSETGGLVSKNKAKNELQQLLAEDPLPLQRAKINQGATVRAAQKSSKAAARASEEAEAAAQRARDATAAADAALQEAVDNFKTAEEFLEEVKSKPGSGKGSIWWIERELYEAKKYLPQSKGGIR